MSDDAGLDVAVIRARLLDDAAFWAHLAENKHVSRAGRKVHARMRDDALETLAALDAATLERDALLASWEAPHLAHIETLERERDAATLAQQEQQDRIDSLLQESMAACNILGELTALLHVGPRELRATVEAQQAEIAEAHEKIAQIAAGALGWARRAESAEAERDRLALALAEALGDLANYENGQGPEEPR